MLEVSFPAFAGSSGAPVYGDAFRTVLGVLIANRHLDLPPSQIETVWDEDGSVVSEVRYQVPHGLAVGFPHIRDALASAGEALM